MKKLIIPILSLFAFAAFADDKVEKTTTTTTTTTTRGTITEYAPGKTFIIKEESGPVTYSYGKEVVYVTRGGKTLTDEQVRTRIKVGIPVSVHFIKEGDRRVIRRVEVDDD
jgi:endonuclease YncB( thermonuclease family)